jgi:hypothetical protein
VSQQVKVNQGVKRELELFAAISGRTQGDLLSTAWREYRDRHASEFHKGLDWARSVLGDPVAASVAASGMSADDIAEIEGSIGD